jgi:methylenetetrahydrofolate--tRNA-(uracil-5-)-methyltransferase
LLAHAPTKDADGKRLRGTEKSIAKKRGLCLRALADLERWDGGARLAAAE